MDNSNNKNKSNKKIDLKRYLFFMFLVVFVWVLFATAFALVGLVGDTPNTFNAFCRGFIIVLLDFGWMGAIPILVFVTVLTFVNREFGLYFIATYYATLFIGGLLDVYMTSQALAYVLAFIISVLVCSIIHYKKKLKK